MVNQDASMACSFFAKQIWDLVADRRREVKICLLGGEIAVGDLGAFVIRHMGRPKTVELRQAFPGSITWLVTIDCDGERHCCSVYRAVRPESGDYYLSEFLSERFRQAVPEQSGTAFSLLGRPWTAPLVCT